MNMNDVNTDFEEVQPAEKTLTTSCRDCVFAIKDGKLQTGCELGRVEAYSNRGVAIIEAEDLEENEFYVLETWCNTYREDVLKVAHEGEDLKDIVYNELDPKVQFVVIINSNLDEIETTINSIFEQEAFSAKEILLVNNGEDSCFDVIQKAKELLEDKIDFKVQQIKEELPILGVIDEAFKNAQNGYYSVIECGKETRRDLIATLHEAVNVKLKKAGYIKGWDGINGMTVQCVLHQFLVGNNGASLEEKISDGENMDGVEEGNSLIKTWDELK